MDPHLLTPALSSALDDLQDLLKDAKDKPITGGDVPGTMFLPAVALYKELFDKMGVKSTEQFEDILNSTNSDEVKNLRNKLKSLEDDWNNLLTTVDPTEGGELVLVEGDPVPGPVRLLSARTGVETDLHSLLSSSPSSYLHLVLLRYLS